MNEMVKYIINLIIFVPFTLALIIITMRLNKDSFSKLGMNKYVKVLEKTNLNRDTEVFVLKMGDEGCVLVSSPSKTYKIKELNKEEIEEIERKNKDIKINNENIKSKLKKINLKEIKNGRVNSNTSK